MFQDGDGHIFCLVDHLLIACAASVYNFGEHFDSGGFGQIYNAPIDNCQWRAVHWTHTDGYSMPQMPPWQSDRPQNVGLNILRYSYPKSDDVHTQGNIRQGEAALPGMLFAIQNNA